MLPVETLNAFDWNRIGSSIKEFFLNGLGGPGAEALGIAVAAIGVIMAVFSYFWNKYNQRSSLPGPLTNLGIALFGTFIISGLARPIEWLKTIRDVVFGWFGV